jgi:hypothetical protein
MNINKCIFKLVAILTLIIVPASFIQARPHKRKAKARAAVHAQAFTRMRWYLDDTKLNEIIASLERQGVFSRTTLASPVTTPDFITNPRITTLPGAPHRERILLPRAATTGATFAIPTITDTRPEWMKRFTAERHDSWRSLTDFRKQGCEPSLSIGGGIGVANFAYTHWKDNYYGSFAVGWSSADLSASVSRGMCEPSTGVFVNATLVTLANQGKVNSFSWYYGKKPSFERTYSTPNASVAVGVTFKFWPGSNKTS